MKVLVTGGAGFIASHVVDIYLSAGHEVIIVDNLDSGKQENLNPKARFYNIDIRNLEKIKEVFEKEQPDIVNHHAAQSSAEVSVHKPIEDYEINVLGLINVLECCVANKGGKKKKNKVKKFLFSSTASVYGTTQPSNGGIKEEEVLFQISPYGAGKLAGELYVKCYNHLHGLPYVIFRYSNVYGPRQAGGEAGVVSIFAKALQQGKQGTIFGDGEQTRDYVYVGDIAKANLLALEKGENVILNIGSGTATSINELAKQLKEITGNGEFLQGEARPGDIRHSKLNVERARSVLGWSVETSFTDGLRQTVEWFKVKKD